ncbi:MAG: glycosyltransferase family 4 protein [Prevotellaceae bacterium]|jgi:glycosyltransferase involved in cell wall biosynthesis|nr:glycosyltransferase family 4 protein [Prevotellaceae bacterium]
MIVAFDAKRAFHNHRGLGAYSRQVLQLMSRYAPESMQFILFDPHPADAIPLSLTERFSVEAPESPLDKLFPSLWRSVRCVKQIAGCGAAIYHGLSQELPQGIERLPVKKVVTMHDAIFIRYPELYDRLYRRIFIRKNQYSCRVADRIIAVSEQTKRDFIEFFDADPAGIDVVYQGCDNRFRHTIEASTLDEVRRKYRLPTDFLLTVGAIERRKNLEITLHAMHQGGIDAPLVVVGNPTDYLHSLKNLINTLGLHGRVIFLHHVPTDDLPAIYRMASVMVYPSLFEGFGIPILEALCSGVPVVTSDGSCFRETGGKSSIYVSPTDAEAMNHALKRTLSDSTLRETMIADGRLHAETFNDETIAKALLNVYTHLR